jgi:hypothetical protein
MLELVDMMQQHDFDVLIQEEYQRFNKSKREKVVLKYGFSSPPYYRKG